MLDSWIRRCAPLVIAVCVLLSGSTAEASHFRFGNISWTVPNPVTAPRTVRFTVTHGWRAESVSSTTLQFGDATTAPATMGTEIGSGSDIAGTRYRIFRYTVDHTYAAGAAAGPITAFFSSSARIAGLVNGANAGFRVQTVVSLLAGNTAGPVTSAPAIISLSIGAVRTYLFPVFDPDFDPLNCRIATSTEAGFSPTLAAVPAGGATPTVAAVPGGCLLTWDLTRALSGQRYVLPLVLQSTHSSVVSTSPLDLIAEVSGRASPMCVVGSTPSSTGTFVTPVGTAFTTAVTGTNPTAGALTMTAIGTPTGSVLNPVDGSSSASPFRTTFTWTPSAGFLGTTQSVLVNYRNSDGLTATCFLTLQVPSCTGFGTPCSVGVGACLRTGMNVCAGSPVATCNVVAGSPSAETCNNLDDNCDGTTDEANASCPSSTPFCNSMVPRCEQCRSSADCSGATPICDGTTHACRACSPTMAGDCTGATPACATAGINAGRCVVCTTARAMACVFPRSLCDDDENTCRGCISNADCSGALPICHTATGVCRACDPAMAADCTGATPACATAGPSLGRCVECTSTQTTACVAPMRVCDRDANRCRGCTSNGDCSGATPICDGTSRLCRACSETRATDCSAPMGVCATTGMNLGRCVSCTPAMASACLSPRVCDAASNTCTMCVTHADCGAETPVCDALTRLCRPCNPRNAMDCAGASPVCAVTGANAGRCVACTAASAGSCSGTAAVCDLVANTCVGCVSDADCSVGNPICDVTRRSCRPCTMDSDCTGAAPVCALSGASAGRCVQCTSSNPGVCAGPLSCNVATSSCGMCTRNEDCGGNTPFCDATTRICRPCDVASATECTGTTPACAVAGPNAGRCVECTGMMLSRCTGSTSICSASNRCVGCRSDMDCSGATPACGPLGVCVQCTGTMSAACTGVTPACHGTGNRCVLCTSGPMGDRSQCAMSADGTACLSGAADSDPPFCGCAVDSDCGGLTSGRICDGMTRRCRAGCWPGELHNGCPTERFCTSTDPMTQGVCTTTCARDGDCTMNPAQSRCALRSPMNACVECLQDSHCAARSDGRTRCVGSSDTCAECSATERGVCSAAGRGAACLSTGLCGCAMDSDCSAERLCEVAMGACVLRPGPDAGVDAAADVPLVDVAAEVSVDVAPDALVAPRARATGSCNCRVPGSPTPGPGRFAALGIAGLAGVLAGRRRRPQAAVSP